MPARRSAGPFLRAALLASLLLSAGSGAARAAAIDVKHRDDGRTVVTLAGDIEDGDRDRLAQAVAGRSSVLVVLSSGGGWTLEGIALGELIRLRQFDTAVAAGSECASACALAWLGGVRRYLEAGARVGFHAAFTIDEDGLYRESGAANAAIGAYLTNLGFALDAVVWATNASPNDIAYLDETIAAEVGIAFDRVPMTVAAASPKSLEPKRFVVKTLEQKTLAAPVDPDGARIARAEAFVDRHFAEAGAADGNPEYVARHYAATVRYAGRDVPRETLVETRASAVADWPLSATWRTGPPTVTCPDGGRCTVSGEAVFQAANAERDLRAEETRRYRLVLGFRDGEPVILSEDTVVEGRTITPVTPYEIGIVEEVETALSSAGCAPGAVDGLWDPASDAALRRFAAATGATVDGTPTPAMLGTIRGTAIARSLAGIGPACAAADGPAAGPASIGPAPAPAATPVPANAPTAGSAPATARIAEPPRDLP